MIRCLKDKVPRGSYIVRASVLDRLVDNKMYYKFVEYGNKLKEEQEILRAKQEEDRIQASMRARKLEEEE